MKATPTIIEFVTDPQLLGLSLSQAQAVLLKSIYGLPLSKEELELFQQCTGREKYPGHAFGEVTVIAGARAGKDSRIAAPVAVYEAIFGDHERHLAKGERAIVPVVAQDARATRIAFGYVRDYLTSSPLLAGMVEDVLSTEISLNNRLTVSCFPCTLRSLRGWSIPAGILDELGFYRLEGSADSDAEVQASIRRGMLNFPQPRLVKISTPYMKGGVLYEDFKNGFGKDNPDLLVWKASSLLMNPSLKPERLEREKRLDPTRFSREYEAEFADDLEAFLPAAWIEEAVVAERHELSAREGVQYVGAVDPSGGGADAFTFCIVHSEGQNSERRAVQDLIKGWARRGSQKVDLEGVVKGIAETLKSYKLSSVVGDKYSAGWVREAFQREGIRYENSEDKSKVYLEMEPLFATGRIDLLDHPQLVRELKTLERRPRPGGKTIVDHPRSGHDDFANVLAVATFAAVGSANVRWEVL